MGKLLQTYAPTTTNSKPEVERQAFKYANDHLADMGGCSEGDLAQAFKSYFFQYLREQGAAHLFREAEVEKKAARAGAWWSRKFKKRPHSKYSAQQTRRGHKVSQLRRGAAADIDALRAQLEQQRGVKVSQIAEELDRTPQHTRRLLRRKFSKLLALIVLGTFANNPLSSPPTLDADTEQKEFLANVPIVETTPAQAPPLGNSVDLDAIGASIPDLLKGWWASKST